MKRYFQQLVVLLAVIVPSAFVLRSGDTYLVYIASLVGAYGIATCGVSLSLGFARQISIGHGAFFAIGAYAYALTTSVALLGSPWGLIIALGLGALFGVLFGVLTYRQSAAQAALISIGFAIIANQAAIEFKPLTGGFGGISNVGFFLMGSAPYAASIHFGLIALLFMLLLIGVYNLYDSPWGRAWTALGDDSVALSSLGLSKRYVFVMLAALSATTASLGGWLFAPVVQYVSPDSFTLQLSISFLVASLLGGARHPLGPLLGAVVVVGLPELMQNYADFRLIFYGCALVATVYLLPNGIGPLIFGWIVPTPPTITESKNFKIDVDAPSRLSFQDLSVAVHGQQILANVSGELRPGCVTCVVGPNGAGKTTLLNAISGYVPISNGVIRLDGKNIAHRSPSAIARLGIARTFQSPRLFHTLSANQNVCVGLLGAALPSVLSSFFSFSGRRQAELALAQVANGLLLEMGFAAPTNAAPAALSFGSLRTLEISRSVALRPHVLLLDEPSSGLDPHDIAILIEGIRRLRDRGLAILLITHDLAIVTTLADQVVMLDAGQLYYAGPPNRAKMEELMGPLA